MDVFGLREHEVFHVNRKTVPAVDQFIHTPARVGQDMRLAAIAWINATGVRRCSQQTAIVRLLVHKAGALKLLLTLAVYDLLTFGRCQGSRKNDCAFATSGIWMCGLWSEMNSG